jgi:hypothetical protein
LTIKRTLNFNRCGIKANKIMVNTVKTTIECPEGKLLKPHNFLPIIHVISLLKITAGLGTPNIAFNGQENKSENNKPDSNASHNLGA